VNQGEVYLGAKTDTKWYLKPKERDEKREGRRAVKMKRPGLREKRKIRGKRTNPSAGRQNSLDRPLWNARRENTGGEISGERN